MKNRTVILVAALFMADMCLAALPTVGSNTQPQSLVTPTPIGTLQTQWQLWRTVTVSDTPLTGVTKAWTSIKSKFIKFPAYANRVRISCYADGDGSGEGDPNGGSLSWKLFTCKKFGSAIYRGYGTWAIGELALSHDPTSATESALTYATTDPNSSKWGELPVVTASYHGTITADGTADDAGELVFDPQGDLGGYLEITSFTGMTNLYILVDGF
jgi:hypothetical protein